MFYAQMLCKLRKTIKKSRYVNINTDTHSAGANGAGLGVADVFKLEAVYVGSTAGVTTSDQDVTSHLFMTMDKKMICMT